MRKEHPTHPTNANVGYVDTDGWLTHKTWNCFSRDDRVMHVEREGSHLLLQTSTSLFVKACSAAAPVAIGAACDAWHDRHDPIEEQSIYCFVWLFLDWFARFNQFNNAAARTNESIYRGLHRLIWLIYCIAWVGKTEMAAFCCWSGELIVLPSGIQNRSKPNQFSLNQNILPYSKMIQINFRHARELTNHERPLTVIGLILEKCGYDFIHKFTPSGS